MTHSKLSCLEVTCRNGNVCFRIDGVAASYMMYARMFGSAPIGKGMPLLPCGFAMIGLRVDLSLSY